MWPTSTSDRIRDESPGDMACIAEVTSRAFAGAEHSDGTEAQIIERLRRDGDLALSLVAESGGAIVGHVAFSPVSIVGGAGEWFALGLYRSRLIAKARESAVRSSGRVLHVCVMRARRGAWCSAIPAITDGSDLYTIRGRASARILPMPCLRGRQAVGRSILCARVQRLTIAS